MPLPSYSGYAVTSLVKNNITGYPLEHAQRDGAICIDGTPGFYWHRPGHGSGSSKWYVHHRAGSLCSTPKECFDMAHTQHGSSEIYGTHQLDWTIGRRLHIIDPNRTMNPLMYNWNVAIIGNCDGGSYTGSRKSPLVHLNRTLHFRGGVILHTAISELLGKHGLGTATEVVVGGFSSSGHAVFVHCDTWASRIRAEGNPDARVVCLAEAGFMMDFEGWRAFQSRMFNLADLHESKPYLAPACVAAERPFQRCMFPEHGAKYITTPIFVVQSGYDKWQVMNVLGAADVDMIHGWAANMSARLNRSLLEHSPHQRQNALFLHICQHHFHNWLVMGADGDTVATAFQQWYEQGPGCRRAWIDTRTWFEKCWNCCRRFVPQPPARACPAPPDRWQYLQAPPPLVSAGVPVAALACMLGWFCRRRRPKPAADKKDDELAGGHAA